MASFGKLTEYFSLRKSRPELRSRRWGRRSGSCCCSLTECRDALQAGEVAGEEAFENQLVEIVVFTSSQLSLGRSLDRKLQRPLLGKSRTLPSIPQSPVLSRLPPLEPAAYRDEMPEQKPYKKPSAPEHQKGCTVPSAGEAWRLEDDCSEPPRAPQLGTAVEDAPFSYFRTRSFYMRKSLSVDNHLGSLSYAVHPAESKAERVRTKLRRQFNFEAISSHPCSLGAEPDPDLVAPSCQGVVESQKVPVQERRMEPFPEWSSWDPPFWSPMDVDALVGFKYCTPVGSKMDLILPLHENMSTM
ncbi:hypothetical protein DUI87_05582 [Hirundo rustica rustica]|uniref:Uncharacterized protein n=1 Tax=Hirundo rustica rustica TaxID=333673 RepID=A0A3M0KXM1_HIRRU|nr:hypothetical protein DUI87_05582 [Hirundo rustica rustica]